jgi:hypothetical protein
MYATLYYNNIEKIKFFYEVWLNEYFKIKNIVDVR